MAVARKLGARIFLEGVEVPLVSVEVTAKVMGHATATFSIPPSDAVHDLLPRTLVHIFYYDSTRGYLQAGQKAPETFTFYEQKMQGGAGNYGGKEVDPIDPYNWNLLFAGEIAAYRYVKDQGQRLISFTAFSFTTYWDDAKLYFGAKKPASKNFKQAIFMGAAQATTAKSVIDTTDKLYNVMTAQPKSAPSITGLLGGCISLLESVMGLYRHKPKHRRGKERRIDVFETVKPVRGVTDYLCQAELRLKTIKQLGFNPSDSSSHKLLGKSFKTYVKQIGRRMSSTASYGQLLRLMLDKTYYVYSPVLCPPYIPLGRQITAKKTVPIKTGKASTKAKELYKKVDFWEKKFTESIVSRRKQMAAKKEGLGDYAAQTHDSLNNPIHDAEGIGEWVTENGKRDLPSAQEVADFQAEIEALTSRSNTSKGKKGAKELPLREADKATLLGIADDLQSIAGLHGNLELKVTVNSDTSTPSGKPEDVYTLHTALNVDLVQNDLEKLRKKKKRYLRPRFKVVDVPARLTDRLYTVLFNPLIWMCPPPKCNVVFPNMYSTMSFSRDFRGEVTRLWLYGMKGKRADLKESYFAPNIEIIGGQPKTRDVAKAASKSLSFLLPHEKFSGIIGVMEGVKDAKILQGLNKKAEAEEFGFSKGGKSIFSAVELKKDKKTGKIIEVKSKKSIFGFQGKNPALARTALHKFFSGRFSSRVASVSGPFNPGLVAGLPALILDPYIESGDLSRNVQRKNRKQKYDAIAADQSSDDIELDLGRDDNFNVKGTHYLGLITSITHKISQQGATTQFNLAYTRSHSEGLAVFGSQEATVTLSKKVSVVRGRGKITKKPVLAEVHGFKEVRTRVRNAEGKLVTVTKLVPIIGGDGQKGQTGEHITKDLIKQRVPVDANASPEAIVKHEETKAKEPEFMHPRAPASKEQGKLNNLGALIDTYAVGPHYVEPVKVKSGNTEGTFGFGVAGEQDAEVEMGLDNARIEKDDSVYDGYQYMVKKDWMSAEAVGAVKVHAYKRKRPGGPRVRKFKVTFSFEQVARPPWIDKSYLNHNIGPEVYQELLGCESLTDRDMIHTSPVPEKIQDILSVDTGVSGESLAKAQAEANYIPPMAMGGAADWVSPPEQFSPSIEAYRQSQKVLLEYIETGDFHDVIKIELEDGRQIELNPELLGGITIQESAEKLAYVYSKLRRSIEKYNPIEIDAFTTGYTRRSFASMPDIFGFSWVSGPVTYDKRFLEFRAQLEEAMKHPVFQSDDGVEYPMTTSKDAPGVMGTRYVVPLPEYDNTEYFGESTEDDAIAEEGFHSYAFGDTTNLNALPYCPPFDFEDPSKPADQKGTGLNPNVDPRQERYHRVLAYRKSINNEVKQP